MDDTETEDGDKSDNLRAIEIEDSSSGALMNQQQQQ
jgi:hypothetical protein